ncbi:uncharacterized protein PG986_008866 [Apiospora aurea]|uniref:F-box domain-containing protein n=1 Tax=Apiospora aurea TaxID=335848 RepID=A0ABR1Q6B3_9PEZI
MANSPLLSLPREIRDEILAYAVEDTAYDVYSVDWPTVDALMKTCNAISDELYHLYINKDQQIDEINFFINRDDHASTSWLSTQTCSEVAPFSRHTVTFCGFPFSIRDLNDMKLGVILDRSCEVEDVNIRIEVPQLAAQGRSKSAGLAAIWSKVRDIITIITLFRSVGSINCEFDTSRCTKLDIHRFFHCPVKVDQPFQNSLYTLILWALVDPFIKNGPFADKKLPARPQLNLSCIENPVGAVWFPWAAQSEHHFHPGKSCHDAVRISKTMKRGICTPQNLPKRTLRNLESKRDFIALTENEVLQLRHEARTLSLAVDAAIDTCRGPVGNMLRLHRFATWDCSEADGMSLAAQQNLLRGAGPEDRTIRNRETLMKLLKPAGCDTSSWPVDTWYDAYPQGIEPLDLLAKRHLKCFDEEPEFQEKEITHSKE